MSDKLLNLDAEQLKTLLSKLVRMGVNEVDAEQTLTTLVNDYDAEEQDVELEFHFKGRPSVVMVKASTNDLSAPVFSVCSDDAEISGELAAVV